MTDKLKAMFSPDPGASRLAASMDRLLAARDLRRGGAATPAAIDASPSARLAASMDRELARQGIRKAGTALGFVSAAGNPGVSEASKPVDISGMDPLSRSMRAALPQPQRAAYDRDWKQSESTRSAPIASKILAPSPAPAIAPTPRVDATASGVFDPQPPAASALALWSPRQAARPGATAKAADVHPRSGDTAIFEAAFGRAPRDIAELDKTMADADARSLARGLDADRRGLSEMF
jgi:hypothetical protein